MKQRIKILYCVSKTVCQSTILSRGVMVDTGSGFAIEAARERIVLDGMSVVVLYRTTMGLGTMIQLVNHRQSIYLTVPRLFIDKGTGFAIINTLATRRLKKRLEQAVVQPDAVR